jgi:predicted nucleic acid-binding protein
MDFIDAYNIAYIKSKEFTKVATFDVKHYGKVEGTTVIL